MKNEKIKTIIFAIYIPLSIVLMELLVKAVLCTPFFSRATVFTLIFSLSAGFVCTVICGIWQTARGRRRALSISMTVLTFVFCVQAIYYNNFGVFATLYSATGAADVMQFWRETLQNIWNSKWILLLIVAPLVLWLVFGKRLTPEKCAKKRFCTVCALFFLVFQAVGSVSATASTSGVQSASYLYSSSFIPNLTVSNFGVLTTLRLDIKYLILGHSKLEDTEEEPFASDDGDTPEPSDKAVVTPFEPEELPAFAVTEYGDNVLEIDFDALIDNETDNALLAMHEYFSALTPTSKNEYTGMFEGKNLIWICAEAFDTIALDKTHTPTLYKLANEGFVFENFYTPLWGVSTSDGEYVTTTGLIPKSGVWSYAASSENYMPFAFGSMFSELGYKTMAYHNHSYDYYDRHRSHPNMGYEYKAVGQGLNISKSWPESDLEMMQATVPEYINEERFHAYYMTVSGHLNYNFYGNEMAMKHESEVADLPYSEEARAYIACNMELDLALKYLIKQLGKAGVLEDTVICISGDHYPYGLSDDAISELAGFEVDTAPELYKSTLILWCAAMEEPVYVDKHCASLDIMPTLANLFGLEYDSRLIMGHDILSDYPALVEFCDRSWISDYGYYDALTDSFTPFDGVNVPEGYERDVMALVNERFIRSAEILENDYYSIVLGAES